ncbi:MULTISPECIES: hypothetical protein [unclassified Lentimonas]|nr:MULTISPECIES: hypothetical protein [unclassified Lentimonas]
MNKLLTIAVMSCVATSLYAAKGDQTKDQFVAKEKAKWEEKGWKWNQAKVESNFAEMDTNKDGIASGKERQVWFKAKAAANKK